MNIIRFTLFLCIFIASVNVSAQNDSDELSLIAPRASQSLVLGMYQAKNGKIYAVGERGHVLHSTDGTSWAQEKIPSKRTLTSVFFSSEKKGWVVGHDSIILATEDGGSTWRTQYLAPEKEQPLFDVMFVDDKKGFAIGAYGMFLTTNDGGNLWQEIYLESLDDPTYGLPHFYRIVQFTDKIYYMAGEAGFFAQSEDGGETWERIKTPYRGSYFNMYITPRNSLLLMGLRGHLLRSDDAGKTWSSIETGTVAGLTAATAYRGDSIVVAGMEGVFLMSNDDGKSFELIQHPDRHDYSAIGVTPDNALLLAGEAGLQRIGDLKQLLVKP